MKTYYIAKERNGKIVAYTLEKELMRLWIDGQKHNDIDVYVNKYIKDSIGTLVSSELELTIDEKYNAIVPTMYLSVYDDFYRSNSYSNRYLLGELRELMVSKNESNKVRKLAKKLINAITNNDDAYTVPDIRFLEEIYNNNQSYLRSVEDDSIVGNIEDAES